MDNKNSELKNRGKIITMLFTAFGQGGESERMAMYVKKLQDVPVDVLDKACDKAIMESKYLPSIAELIQAAKELVAHANGTDVVPFAEAWKEIEKQMHDVFVYGVPKFSRPEIKQTVDAFGWQELCEMRTQDIPIIRAQLKAIYESICKKNAERAMNGYVLGAAVLIEDGRNARLMLNE